MLMRWTDNNTTKGHSFIRTQENKKWTTYEQTGMELQLAQVSVQQRDLWRQ
jgi:hypothetical protein